MEHDRIARLDVALGDVLLLQRRLDIRCGDLLTGIHHPALERDHVEKMRAGKERLELLDTELLQTVCVADLQGGVTVVEPHLALVAVLAELNADVAEAVELCAGLPDLGGEKFVMIHKLVVAERAAGRTAGNAQRERARTEKRHAALVDAADLVDLAVLYPFHRVEHLRRRDVIGCAALVIRAPF
jgi:hypothetical protein